MPFLCPPASSWRCCLCLKPSAFEILNRLQNKKLVFTVLPGTGAPGSPGKGSDSDPCGAWLPDLIVRSPPGVGWGALFKV